MKGFACIALIAALGASAAPAALEKRSTGQATYFYQNGVAGNCGSVNSDDAYIVALQSSVYDGGAHCGQTVKITNTSNGKSITAKVADSCPSCGSSGDLDLSYGAFTALGSADEGVLPISWSYE